jgi:uncharacterized membrane protein
LFWADLNSVAGNHTFTLGVALANQFLRKDEGRAGNLSDQDDHPLNATASDISATSIGATIIAFNIAPTNVNSSQEFFSVPLVRRSRLI